MEELHEAAASGRSPRTRGSQGKRSGWRSMPRSIPAHAGEPAAGLIFHPYCQVDPRARGGAYCPRELKCSRGGRSPRTRGSQVLAPRRDPRHRSIPAHAGEPAEASGPREEVKVDPRARGGATRVAASPGRRYGRSPRTRGSPFWNFAKRRVTRSIPAHAGEPFDPSPSLPLDPVDPRARGGALCQIRHIILYQGRSPRTRGSLLSVLIVVMFLRSIPAHAGEPAWPYQGRSILPVDPRARGGAVKNKPLDLLAIGRSPRTRGSQYIVKGMFTMIGSIPAHAGEPRRWRFSSRSPGVDPRARGGALFKSSHLQVGKGRSPRTRGSPDVGVGPDGDRGSIPAHAGEPVMILLIKLLKEVDPRARGGAPGIIDIIETCNKVDPRARGGAGGAHIKVPPMKGRSPRTRGSLDD